MFQAWIQQYTQVGYDDPKKETDNYCANQEIYQQNFIQLAIYFTTNPKVTTNKICEYLLNLQDPGHLLPPFSLQQV